MSAIQNVWQAAFSAFVYDAKFLDEKIAAFYGEETKLQLVYEIFASLAIFISCLGLYGMVSFMALNRTKEVGVRKVLGASVVSIVYILSKEFTLLILFAFALAAPISFFICKSWLENYQFRIPIGAGIFLIAIGSSVLIAWITVGFKALKAATANPVKSLKAE